jgi:Spy/CpxP family protein refolding chaperone
MGHQLKVIFYKTKRREAMNNMTRVIKGSIPLVMIVIFFCSVPVDAYQWGESKHGKMSEEKKAKFKEELFKELNLTPEQEKAMQQHKEEQRSKMKIFRGDIKAKKKELRQELQNTDLDMKKVKEINSELKVLLSNMLDHRLEGILGVRSILTPDQFKEFSDFKNKHKRYHKGG